jgi:hypothetical protein
LLYIQIWVKELMKLKNPDMCVHAYFMCVLPPVYVHHTFFIINVSGNNIQKKRRIYSVDIY